MKSFLILSISVLSAVALFGQSGQYAEKYRPRFHFSPASNWMNDPNGLVYYKGEYHLFFQHNPFGNRWGHMSWGHSISHDLIHWQHLPVAISEEKGTMIFSGSAVADYKNSSGFAQKSGQTPLVAVYTGLFVADSTHPDNSIQYQDLAYSLDGGLNWTKYSGNPVLDLHRKDFRDPFVFWYEPQKKWVMAVVWPREHLVQFYDSKNLIQWKHTSDFGPAGDASEIWECPSLAEVPVEGMSGKKKWVMMNSQQTTMQYFVGEFDGSRFVNENPSSVIYRPDYGSDFYAGVTYNQLPEGQLPVLVGWANNWSYANDIPTDPWKSMMGLPRQLSLKQTSNGWILKQSPPAALAGLRENHWEAQTIRVENRKAMPIHSIQAEIYLEWTPEANSKSGLLLALGMNQSLQIGYDSRRKMLYFDRQFAGDTTFNAAFAKLTKYEAPLDLLNQKLRLQVFIDHSLVEIFANEGEIVMTTQIFPDPSNDGIALFSEGAATSFDKMETWLIRSVWQ